MTDLDRLELLIPNANIQQLREIMKIADSIDVSAQMRQQVWAIHDNAEQRIRELSGFGGDY